MFFDTGCIFYKKGKEIEGVFRVFQYLIEFLKWSSAGFFTVQLLSNHRSASVGLSVKKKESPLVYTEHNNEPALQIKQRRKKTNV